MISTALILSLVAIAALAVTANLAMAGTGRARLLYGAASVGIAALSQQFLVAVIAGALLVLLGLKRQQSENPMHKKLGKMNIVVGLVLIGYAVYMFYLR